MNKHPMKKQSFLTFSLALLFGGTLWAQQKQYTLQECVELALENNITIRQNQLEYASAEIDKRTAFANFLPSINANANHSWNIGLNQNITTGLLENVTTQFSSAGINMGVDVYGGSKTLTSCTALIWLYWLASINWLT